MSEHRFRNQLRRLPARGRVAVAAATGETPSKPAPSPSFVAVPTLPVVPAAMAHVYRLAYEAALARIVARRRCFAPFSVN